MTFKMLRNLDYRVLNKDAQKLILVKGFYYVLMFLYRQFFT